MPSTESKMDNAVTTVNDFGLKGEIEKLFSRIKSLAEKHSSVKDENRQLKDKLKELEQALSEIKIDFSNKNSEILIKDRELTELKNKLSDNLGFTGADGPARCAALVAGGEDPQAEIDALQRKKIALTNALNTFHSQN